MVSDREKEGGASTMTWATHESVMKHIKRILLFTKCHGKIWYVMKSHQSIHAVFFNDQFKQIKQE